MLRGGAAAHKKTRGQGPPGPPNPLPLADRTQLAPQRANMGQGRQEPAARHRDRPMNGSLGAALSTWEKTPGSGVLSAWVLYLGKTPASGWFIGCFIEIKHPAAMAGVLLKVLGGGQPDARCIDCRWAAMGLAAYRSRPGACDRHMRRLCSIRPRHSRALCARLCQARPCPPLADSPASLGA